MYERFTDRAKKVMQLADEEARRFSHEYVGTEHILLGLVKEGSGTASWVLKNLDIDPRKIRIEVEKILQRGPEVVTQGRLPQTPRAKKVIEYAMDESRNLGHSHVGTEHLLLGLLREQEGVASQVLMNLGLKLEDLREETLNVSGDESAGAERGAVTSVPTAKPQRTRTPALDSFCRDLTELARQGKLHPVLGRDHEIDHVVQILCRQHHHCPILAGPRGVGKDAVVDGLCRRIVDNDVPERLAALRILKINLLWLVAGTKYRGTLEDRIRAVCDEIRRANNVVLVINGEQCVQQFLTDGESKWSLQMFLSSLEEGKARFIVTMHEEQMNRSSLLFDLLRSQCGVVSVRVPSESAIRDAMFAHRDDWEGYHRVQISDQALHSAISLVQKYIAGPLSFRIPADLVDSACAISTAQITRFPDEFRTIQQEIGRLNNEKEEAVANQDFDRAVQFRDAADKLRRSLEAKVSQWKNDRNIPVVDEESIKQAFADMSGLDLDRKPVRKISIDQLYGSEYSPAVPQNSWVQPECSPTQSTASEYERHQIESVFHSQPGGIQRGLGFVLLPHKPEFQAIYEEAISPAFRANNLEPLKADDIYRPGSILSQVWSQIRTAEVLVADVSGLNPNVIFELGLCHGMHRCPILLVRDPAELPFNLRSLRYIVYSNDITGIKRLREQLKRSIEEFIAATRPADEIPNGESVHE